MIVHPFVLIGLIIIIGVPFGLRCERCVCFNGKSIRRHMRRIKRDYIGHRLLPIGKGFACCPVHDVEIEGCKASLFNVRDSTLNVFRVVRTPKRLQNMINR